jgi:azurin
MKPASLFPVAALALLALPGVSNAACAFDIEVGDTLAYSTNEMTAEASCDTVTVTIKHTGKLPAAAMGHNWVLTQPDDFQPVANAGMSAGLDGNYVPPNDDRVIASTAIVGGGESDTIEFSIAELDAGDYTFFCSFPGHWSVMKGTFTIS